MIARRPRGWLVLAAFSWGVAALAAVPVTVTPVAAPHAMVVAGHPQAAAIGVEVLRAGGNAMDAAVAVSLALGVAEPYGSGLGGKLLLLHYEAATGKTTVVEAMDAAGSLDVAAYVKRPAADRSLGYGSVCVPGLAAGLWAAHQRWGRLPWATNVAPAIRLARAGSEILPKTRASFEERESKLRAGDAEIARLYLPGGALPVIGTQLANPDLARTMELLSQHGRDGFYRGPVADAIVAASQKGGGVLTTKDLAQYTAHFTEPVGIDFRGHRLLAGPPPSKGPPLFLTIMKVLEDETFGGGPLRTAANLDLIGRVWREVEPLVDRDIADAPQSRFNFERMVAPDSIQSIRARVLAPATPVRKVAMLDDGDIPELAAAETTHFVVADAAGNIVCATQSLSLHFGAAVVPPGTGVVLNNSMSNFAYSRSTGLNYVAPGRRPRSTISPTIVFRADRPVLAIGLPGGGRIPTAMLQALLDRLALNRPLAEAIGDTRIHYQRDWAQGGAESFEAEASLSDAAALRQLGWKVELVEPAGTGKAFGGITAVEINPTGGYVGYADPRRTNAAAGY
jgi:gamma-glutamyltranspeptidase / glutathione hydrolase